MNELANLIARATPPYKLSSGTPPVSPEGYRGNVVVVYSPTKMGGQSSLTLAPHGPDGTTFSVSQLQRILIFFTTAAAVRKGREMNDPMTRMFAGAGIPAHAAQDAAIAASMRAMPMGDVITWTRPGGLR